MLRVAVLLFVVAAVIEAGPLKGSSADVAKWNDFKKNFGKSYATIQEETARFNIFLENARKVEKHNVEFKAGRSTYNKEINKFSDMTNQEFRAQMNGVRRPPGAKREGEPFIAPIGDVPPSVDWRTQGYVTPVKNQGGCGSCWAFSTTGSLEGQNFKKTKKLVSLSEQDLVDCSQNNGGCEGGWMDTAFSDIKKNGGIDTEDSYPYEAQDDTCRFSNKTVGATDKGYVDVTGYNETALLQAVATVGPISVAIDAADDFQAYSTGVYYDPNCDPDALDHGVLVVGYDQTDDGQKYWIVKNSWGADWGNNGYIWMARDRDNNCGIATAASYPKV